MTLIKKKQTLLRSRTYTFVCLYGDMRLIRYFLLLEKILLLEVFLKIK